MFEQSLVSGSGASARPWTVPAAAAGQALVVSAVLLVPLVFPAVLPLVRMSPEPLAIRPVRVEPYRPAARPASSAVTAPSNAPRLPRPFVAPINVPPQIALLDERGAPPLDAMSGVASGNPVPGAAWTGLFSSGVEVAPPPPAPVPPAKKPEPAATQAPRRVDAGGLVRPPELIHYVKPTYPPLARQARIQGAVRIAAVIALDGSLTSMQLLSGHPLLVKSATDAASQWRYRPTLLNGRPVEVALTLDVNFTLSN